MFEIRPNSLDDGPGIRTVLFFKGCPLTCVWCHNPEGKNIEIEMALNTDACIGCRECVRACKYGARHGKKTGRPNRKRCQLCFTCVDLCPTNALMRVGRFWEFDEILEMIAKDVPFMATSGGGVTLSGGEPTMQMEYAGDVLKAAKALGVGTLIETCGHFSLPRFREIVFPHVDMIYMDIKLIDPVAHKRYCGVTNDIVLRNFAELTELCIRSKKDLLPRVPLVPAITATGENLEGIAQYLRQLGHRWVKLLPYNPTWTEKARRLGVAPEIDNQHWMAPDEIFRCEEIFREKNLMIAKN